MTHGRVRIVAFEPDKKKNTLIPEQSDAKESELEQWFQGSNQHGTQFR